MHALLVTAHVEPGREEEGLEYLRTSVLPQLKQIPELLSGYWLETKDGESLAVVFFESEEAARGMAEDGLPNAPQPPGATLGTIAVREVVAHT